MATTNEVAASAGALTVIDGWRGLIKHQSGNDPQDLAQAHDAVVELIEVLWQEYAALADVRNEWPGRNTMAGQARLCRLRDALSSATGLSPEGVQNEAGVRAARALSGGA